MRTFLPQRVMTCLNVVAGIAVIISFLTRQQRNGPRFADYILGPARFL
jgi:hypothetical protein